MGNVNMSMSPASCFQPCTPKSVSLIYWDGTTAALTRAGRRSKLIAGEIMVDNPDKVVCNSESFFIGHPIPALSIHDELVPGQTYLVLPVDLFACTRVLTASSLAAFASAAGGSGSGSGNSKSTLVNFAGSGKCQPLQYLKGLNGGVLIKVAPEFMIRLLVKGGGEGLGGRENEENVDGSGGFLCSTPELKKCYEQLVGCREVKWSPKVETISECSRVRYSPCRFIGLEWKREEEQYCS